MYSSYLQKKESDVISSCLIICAHVQTEIKVLPVMAGVDDCIRCDGDFVSRPSAT